MTHRHHDGVEDELPVDCRLRRPSDYLSGEQVQDDGQIEPPLPGSNVGYVRDLCHIGLGNVEVALQSVWNGCRWLALCLAPGTVSAHRSDAVGSHDARNSMFAAGFAGFSKVEKDSGRTVNTMAC